MTFQDPRITEESGLPTTDRQGVNWTTAALFLHHLSCVVFGDPAPLQPDSLGHLSK